MNQNAEIEDYDDQRSPGFFARMKDLMMGHDEDEEEEEVEASQKPHFQTEPIRSSGGSTVPIRRNGSALRLDQTRRTRVTVRRAMRNFDDAQRAADGLKEGQQQIINLEQTPVEMAERIIDFLNGATYALDGSVEKIGEQVYLFTPASVTIDVETKAATDSRSAFIDKIGS
jgi:cell division inhibitor SepF